MADRVTQAIPEVAISPTSAVRVTQETPEVNIFTTSELARVTQTIPEVDIFPTSELARVTQAVWEVVYVLHDVKLPGGTVLGPNVPGGISTSGLKTGTSSPLTPRSGIGL